MHQYWKKILIPASLLALALFLVPHFAHAMWPFPSLEEIVAGVVRLLAYLFNWLFALLFMLGAFLVKAALSMNFNILTTQNNLVQVGWKISRDVANLGFVLLIIIIAFGTILRLENYGAKKLLPMLIAAAIIVNFSLAIGGVLITFSNVLSNSFLSRMNGDITTTLAAAFGPQKLLLPPDNPPPPDPSEQGGAVVGFGAAILISLANLVFICVFTLIAALVMLLIAFMLLIRYIVLSFLLVIAPIVWLFWSFPSLKHLFSKWWSSFIEWVFFAPAMLFFVYIAILSADGLSKVSQATGSGFSGAISTVMSSGMQMILLAGILVGGVIAAQKMGIAGAQAGLGAIKGVGKGAGKFFAGKAIEKFQRGKQGFAKSKAGQTTTRGLGVIGKWTKGFASWKPKNKWVRRTTAPLRAIALKPLQFNARMAGAAATAGSKNLQKSAVKPVKPYAGTLFGNVFNGMKEGSGLFAKKEKRGKRQVEDELADVRKGIEDYEKEGKDQKNPESFNALKGLEEELNGELARFERSTKRAATGMENAAKNINGVQGNAQPSIKIVNEYADVHEATKDAPKTSPKKQTIFDANGNPIK